MFADLTAKTGGDTDALVDRARAGDEAAYEVLLRRVEDRLLFYARLRLGRQLRLELEPEDILQEAFAQIHKSFADFEARGEGAFCRWAYRILDHRIRDIAERARARKRSPSRPLLRFSEAFSGPAEDGVGPATACERAESRERVLEALESLTEDQRELLTLRFFHGLSLSAIAERLTRSKSGAREALARAQSALGRRLREAR